jgi:hypothetical protein
VSTSAGSRGATAEPGESCHGWVRMFRLHCSTWRVRRAKNGQIVAKDDALGSIDSLHPVPAELTIILVWRRSKLPPFPTGFVLSLTRSSLWRPSGEFPLGRADDSAMFCPRTSSCVNKHLDDLRPSSAGDFWLAERSKFSPTILVLQVSILPSLDVLEGSQSLSTISCSDKLLGRVATRTGKAAMVTI